MIARKKLYYRGVPTAPYDLVKEFLGALLVVTILVVILAAVLSSPDEPPLTIQQIAQQNPTDFLQTALSELNGSSGIAGYGPPYNNSTGSVQQMGPFTPQHWAGVHISVNTAQDYVLGPLSQVSFANPRLASALKQYNAASAVQQGKWTDAYTNALNKATVHGSAVTVPSCACGPVTPMMAAMLQLGQGGAMDGQLLTTSRYYQTDYTRPLLFLADSGAVQDHANQFHLLGSQWGVMNETGNYPGQAWLWLYTTFYQIWPFNVGAMANTAGDLGPVVAIAIASLLLILLPWIPGLNRLPHYLGVYRLIWKDYYRQQRTPAAKPKPPVAPPPPVEVSL
jgi:hypothetical protein